MKNKCPLCGGKRKKGKTIFVVDLKPGLLIIKNVPAYICEQCGEEWIEDNVADKIQEIAEESKGKKYEVEIVSLASR